MTQAERSAKVAAKIQEVGEYFLNNNMPSLKAIGEKFNISPELVSTYVTKHLKNKKIGVIK